ncbi:MAG: glycoside hydrolase family 13 protein [Candidatus Izemoplasmatales bacterium]|nr:glycoside hydrolase family 13 protein [Candidatus Izemoplasmatales bacterium]
MENIVARHYESKEYIYPIATNKMHVKLEILCGQIDKVSIKYWKRFKETEYSLVSMENFSLKFDSPYYEVVIENYEQFRYLNYYFILEKDNEIYYLGKDALSKNIPLRFFEYQYVNENDVFQLPKWVSGRVGYQIFVDRFNRVKTSDENSLFVDWKSEPTRENVYGGNLRGVIEKLDYLEELGISLIVFMPIFKAKSNHKYDTVDYFAIDPTYGSEEDLIDLVKKAHQKDIKIILDGVFNHIGYYANEFQDVLKNGKKSKYYSWFSFDKNNKENYLAVGDYKWMPKLNYESDDLCEFIISVGKYWLEKCNIDGWRLDVFDEIEERFRNRFSQEIRKTKKDVLLISETWHDGYELLASHQVDSVMNYLFRDYVIDYFINQKLSAEEFVKKLDWLRFRYPEPLMHGMYNLLGSHDTERIMNRANGNIHNLLLAYAFLVFSQGVPVIYYGDEIGMTGAVDPGCRKAMEWDKVGNEMFREIKSLLDIRNKNEVIKHGKIKFFVFDSLVGFIRSYREEKVLILFNTLDIDKEVSLPELLVDDTVLVNRQSYKVVQL